MFKRGKGIIYKGRKNQKRFSYFMIFCMVLALFSTSAFATETTDIANHWAKAYI